MKNLKVKSILFSLLAMMAVAVFMTSCGETLEDIQPITEEVTLDQKLSVFKANFPEEYDKINLETIQETESDAANGITFTIIEGNQIIGRYIGLNDQSTGIYMDFSDYKNSVKVYDVNNSSRFQDLQMVYSTITGNYEPKGLEYRKFWCGTACVIGGIAIAASDGPVPAMDALAVAYTVTCLAGC